MNIENLNEAIREAKRFIEKAEKAKKRFKEDPYASSGTKETGAARRSSMDLTRSLSQLRNG